MKKANTLSKIRRNLCQHNLPYSYAQWQGVVAVLSLWCDGSTGVHMPYNALWESEESG